MAKSNLTLTFERDGNSIVIGYFFPYWLLSTDGATESAFDVTTQKLAGADGEEYEGSSAGKRNIVIKARIKSTAHEEVRTAFFKFFAPRSTGTLTYADGTVARKIDYKVESCTFDPDGIYRDVTLSLICPNPIWRSTESETVDMAAIMGLIEYPVALAAEWEVSELEASLMATINNETNVERGLTVIFKADGAVVNPKLIEVTRQESFEVSLTMQSGDILTVTTGRGEKRVTLTRSGITTNINNLWVFGSTWLQAEPGENIFRFSAESGEGALEVSITSTPQFWGV